MPNGFHGSREAWERLEAPLAALDARLERYAADHRLALRRNYHAWPERSLEWEGGGVRRQLQIHLHDEATLSFRLVLVAFQDRGGRRYLKSEVLGELLADDLDGRLLELLERGRRRLAAWPAEALGDAGDARP